MHRAIAGLMRLVLVLLAATSVAQTPLGAAFTYQGRLTSAGTPLNDTADLQFSMWDAAGTGSPPIGGTQIGATQTVSTVTVTDGLFTVQLNAADEFSVNPFNGDARWLEIAVRSPAGGGNYTTLSPRQPLSPTPYAAGLAYPVAGSATLDTAGSALLALTNLSNTAGTIAIKGQTDANNSDATGVYGLAQGATSPTIGVEGESISTTGRGVFGLASSATGAGIGVFGRSDGSGGTGVSGLANATSGTNFGVFGRTNSPDGQGVWGRHTSTSGIGAGVRGSTDSTSAGAVGVLGEVTATSPGGASAGVVGSNYGTGTAGIGVWGGHAGGGYGVYGTSVSGRGVVGSATATGGTTYGVYGTSASTGGTGVLGFASAASGNTSGVYGQTSSTSGTGVIGIADAASGGTTGVSGVSYSPDGLGVSGKHLSVSGAGSGVEGSTASTDPSAIGVLGEITSTTPGNSASAVRAINNGTGVAGYGLWASHNGGGYGVYATSISGRAVYAYATAATGNTYGVYARCDSTNGTAVYGFNPASIGTATGVIGQSNSQDGTGVRGYAEATGVGASFGGSFQSQGQTGTGVFGLASATVGTNYGVYGESDSAAGYGGYFVGRGYFSDNVGIGIQQPTVPLQVIGGTDASLSGGGNLVLGQIGGPNVVIDNNEIMARSNGAAANLFLNALGGNVGIGTNNPQGFTLAVAGTAAETNGGSWSTLSDARAKTNIRDLPAGSLDKLLALRGRNFEYLPEAIRSGLATTGEHFGFVAQEVERVIPEWVETSSNGTKFITECGTTALIVEALRELRIEKDRQIEELRTANARLLAAKDAEIAALRAEKNENTAALRARLDRLEGLVDAQTTGVPRRR